MKKYFLSMMSILMLAMLCVGLASCSKDGDGDDASPSPASTDVSVSPSTSSLLGNNGSSTSFTVITEGNWNISGQPDWLHLTATSGTGRTNVTITATSENFSDESRSAVLTVTTLSSAATLTVEQKGVLPSNLRVSLSNLTVMSDGFAADLTFGSNTKGYREAFVTESATDVLTERDLYNMLMEKQEYSGKVDWTVSPIVDPGTTIVYCVAAYGNENNADGTHKYGPMTMKKIKAIQPTVYADMPVYNIGYTSSQWSPVTKKQGAKGTRCAKYYYFMAEGDVAEGLHDLWLSAPYAFLAHSIYKPVIEENPSEYAINEQTFSYTRTTSKCFFGTWGIDDANNYSAEHEMGYRDLTSSANGPVVQKVKKGVKESGSNAPRRIPTKQQMSELRKGVKVIRVQ